MGHMGNVRVSPIIDIGRHIQLRLRLAKDEHLRQMQPVGLRGLGGALEGGGENLAPAAKSVGYDGAFGRPG